MSYSYHGHWICNVETKSGIGHITRDGTGWIVEDGDNHRVAVVNRRQEAGPALAAHYDRHSRWVREDGNYIKWTKFGALEVFALEGGGWAVRRNGGRHLMRHDEVAVFPTAEEARAAADAHAGDSLAASNQAADDLSREIFDYK